MYYFSRKVRSCIMQSLHKEQQNEIAMIYTSPRKVLNVSLLKLVFQSKENILVLSGAHFIVCVPIRDWLEKMQVT